MAKHPREESPQSSPSTSLSPEADIATPKSADEHIQTSKYIQTSDEGPQGQTVMRCSLPPHTETIAFTTFEEFEIHYAKVHAYRCSECRKNFPTEHFLGLHISENHDPLNEAKKANGEKTNYDFLVVDTGVDKRSSMLRSRRQRRSSAASRSIANQEIPNAVASSHDQHHTPAEMPQESPTSPKPTNSTTKQPESSDPDIDRLASTMASLKFVPPSVRFGRGGRRGGLSRS